MTCILNQLGIKVKKPNKKLKKKIIKNKHIPVNKDSWGGE